jgi:hypothetical protein
MNKKRKKSAAKTLNTVKDVNLALTIKFIFEPHFIV